MKEKKSRTQRLKNMTSSSKDAGASLMQEFYLRCGWREDDGISATPLCRPDAPANSNDVVGETKK
jgi:hypothetical protein